MSVNFSDNPRTLEIVTALVENQSNLNRTAYSESWLEKGRTREFHYLLAASQELAEFVNSFWLPWWSKAERDMANCRIELVDALHFLLSEAIIQFGDEAATEVARSYDKAEYVHNLVKNEITVDDRESHVIEVARGTIATINRDVYDDAPLDMSAFFMLCLSIDFPLDKLAALYMGKSTLNKFRQDHGYRRGTYKKLWDGVREDNHFMSVWIDEQTTSPSVEQIRQWLELEYAKYKND